MTKQPADLTRAAARRPRNIIIGAGLGCIAVAACACAVVATWPLFSSARYGRDLPVPATLDLDYALPGSVVEGDTFEFVLSLSNTGSDGHTIGYIDLAPSSSGSILDGAVVVSTNPALEHGRGTFAPRLFILDRVLNPGESVTVTFTLRATTPGEHDGLIAVRVRDSGTMRDTVRLTVVVRPGQ